MFRSGYLKEVVRTDFDAARSAYEKVAEQQPSSPFVAQAASRHDNLERLAAYQEAVKDSGGTESAARAAFGAAELLLFQVGKPDQAIEQYAKIEKEFPKTTLASKAAFARCWVLARRLRDRPRAEGALRDVVARYPESDYA